MIKTLDCMFSGGTTENEEHVLPRWMQKRFSLANQTYHLPNGSKITYRNAKIPVGEVHNSRFGDVETRVAEGRASLQDLYLWALKIHIGLIYKNATLRVDIKDPKAGVFWDVSDFGQEVQIFRLLYDVWQKGGVIEPEPFGTVYVAKALTPAPDFDFCHELRSGTVFFQLGDTLVFVSLWDQADGLHASIPKMLDLHHRPRIAAAKVEDQRELAVVGQRVWACEGAYFLYRARRPLSFIRSDDRLVGLPLIGTPRQRPPEAEELAQFCRSFGLRLVHFGGETNNGFESWSPENAV